MQINEYKTTNMSSRSGWIPDMICCHQTAGAASSAINWFQNSESKVSAHYLVDKKGNISNFVPLEKAAWANGTNTTDESLAYHYSKSKIEAVRERKTNANLYTVSIEFENDDTGILTEPQYQAGLWLIKHIISELKRIYDIDFIVDREHLIAHSDLNPTGRAGCPGKDFPFDRFISDLKDSSNEVVIKKPLYCVQTGLYRDIDDAVAMVDKLGRAGIAAYITDMFEN
ncbi:MAG: N-acetylmuramoyl-L-alanine amidase [Clostridia bacterium]|nr:N-acetylmuramoyl-L-alanine amidase [Clostridia bacterium]